MSSIYLSQRVENNTPCRCDNCGHTHEAHEANDISDAQERLTPGDLCPVGECPECGALTYTEETNRRHERSSACLKACEGISNEALSLGGPFAAARAAITQRDEAIAAIRELLAMLEGEAPLNTKRAYDVIES